MNAVTHGLTASLPVLWNESLQEWQAKRQTLENGMGLQSKDKLKVVRLLGKQPLAAGSEREIARVFLSCHVIEP